MLHRALQRVRSVIRGGLSYLRGQRGRMAVYGLRLFYNAKLRLVLSQQSSISDIGILRDIVVRVGGRSSFRRIRKHIRRARASIVVQTFIWKNDATGRSIAQLLLEAADRGVAVHIAKEPAGELFEKDVSFSETRSSTDPLWINFWSHRGITIDQEPRVDHSKFWIIDGRIVLLSGMNIADEYEWKLHDFQVELRSEALARDVLERRSTVSRPSDRAAIVVNSKDALDIRPCVESLIRSARDRIIIEHCYHSDPRIMALIAEATHRGVPVVILTPRDPEVNGHANRSALKELKRHSDLRRLTILEYPKRFHAKLMLVDGHSCLLGSANLNTLSLDRTGEVCVLLTQGSRAVRKIERRLQLDVFRSSIITVSKLDLVRRTLRKLRLM